MNDKIIVIHSNGDKDVFKPRMIAQTIINETGIERILADKIQDRIAKKLYKLKQNEGLIEISTSDIRAEVSSQLLKEGEFKAVEKSRKLGMSVSEFEDLLQNGCQDNANIGYSPEMIAKYAYDSIAKEYSLLKMPEHCAQAHIDGYYHLHDLEYFELRPNCLSGRNNIIVKDDNNNIFHISIQEFVEEKFFSEENFYVPTLNIKTNKIEWKKVLNAYLSSRCEETYLVTFGKGYSIECTLDHKFIKSHNNKPQKQYDIKVSDFNNYKDLRLCNITNLLEDNSHNNYQASVLFGFFLGDGYISPKGNVKFTFSKKDKAEYLYQLLEDLDVDFTYTIKESDYYQSGYLYSFYIKDKIYPQVSKSELIKRYDFANNLKGVLEGLINSDGHICLDINNALRLNFTSTNKDIFDLYQLCLLSQGIRGSINVTEFDNAKHNDAYNSSSFGEKVVSLLTSITLCDRFIDSVKQHNKKMKQYKEIGELRFKSIEYTGKQSVYNLTIEDNHNYMAGINGFVLTQNCMNYDLRFFAKNGLVVDGIGLMGSAAKPAKSLEVLLNHLLQAWMAGATVFSGGQGYANFNTLLAPFAKGRTYEDIKQAIQGFIFNCNMSLICRGGQVLFTSIGVDLSIPNVLADEPAIGPNGVANGTYQEYQEEADLIFRAILEVSEEKDGMGAYHRFPNILFNIRDGDLDNYDGNCKLLHEKGANNPTLYYVNCTDIERTVMGCFSSDTSLWIKINGQLQYLSFNEIDKLLNAEIGSNKVDNIEVLTINDDKEIIWHKAKNFIKNEPQELYEVQLAGNKSFICDKNHSMITNKGINKKNIFDCKSNLLDVSCILKEEQSHLTPDKRAMLYGFYLGDGKKGDDFKRGYANFMLLKDDKITYVRNLLEDLNIEYKEDIVHHDRDDADYTVFYFSSDEIQKPNLNSIDCLAGLLSGLLSSDGYIRINGQFNNNLSAEFVSTDMEYTRLFKWACFNLGIKFSSRIVQPSKNQKNKQSFERIYISCNYESVRILQQLVLREKQYKIVQSIDNNYRHITETKSQSVKKITSLNKTDYTYCFEVNDRIIVSDDFILTGNCRTALPMNWTCDYETDCLNTGNFAYTTINLPLIALDSNGDIDIFYEKLDKICETAYDALIFRRECVIDTIYNKGMSNFLLQKDTETNQPLYDIDNTTITLGFCGLYECLVALGNPDCGLEIIQFLNNKKDEFHQRDKLRWSVIASPAESTAHRFAEIIKQKYPTAEVQGVKGSYYLTNSNHIPVSNDTDIIDHVKNAQEYNLLTMGGSILHLWMGEVWSDAKGIWSFNKKIINSNVIFWAYSKVFTFCQECQFTINDNLDVCPICGSKKLITYDRCTGYYLPTGGFNKGKQQEFKDRYRHKIS